MFFTMGGCGYIKDKVSAGFEGAVNIGKQPFALFRRERTEIAIDQKGGIVLIFIFDGQVILIAVTNIQIVLSGKFCCIINRTAGIVHTRDAQAPFRQTG